jgi:hypothetical protein
MVGGISLRALCAGAVGLGLAINGAAAADLMVKAPPAPVAEAPLDVHGFFDLTFANDYITPRGLLVTNTGLTTQALMGLVFDLYKNPMGFINDVSVTVGTWNDLWSQQGDAAVGAWNEFDWFVDVDFKFAQFWKFGVEYGEFLPPAHDLPSSFPGDERHIQLALAYDDSRSGFPITFNPYVKWFYETSGPSTVVLGNAGNTYDVELGIVPTVDMKRYWTLPITLSAPTWVTVGPSDYWNRADGTTNFCGPLSATGGSGSASSACQTSNLGVFSTGLTAKAPLNYFIPTRLGNWYVKGGFQYYHIFNDALLASQELTGTAGSTPGLVGGYAEGSYANAHRDVVVGFVGTGFTF